MKLQRWMIQISIMVLSPNLDACIAHNITHIIIFRTSCRVNFTIHACWDVIAKLGKTGLNRRHFDTYIMERVGHNVKKKVIFLVICKNPQGLPRTSVSRSKQWKSVRFTCKTYKLTPVQHPIWFEFRYWSKQTAQRTMHDSIYSIKDPASTIRTDYMY